MPPIKLVEVVTAKNSVEIFESDSLAQIINNDEKLVEIVHAGPRGDTGNQGEQGETGPPGTTNHGELSGLGDDDHPQYHNDARGDARYYTQAQIATLLAGKSDTGHTHDDRYYTQSQTDTLLGGKSNVGHTHDDRYYTESEVDALIDAIPDTTPGGGDGYLQYNNGGAFAASGVYWDDVNSRAGIGTNAPAYELETRKDQNAITTLAVGNATSNTAAGSRFRILGNSTPNRVDITTYSSGFTSSGLSIPDSSSILANSTGGLSLIAGDAAGVLRFATGGAGGANIRMYINASGNVGIGTSAPDRRLDVLDASNPQLRLTHTDGSVYTDFQTNGSGYLFLKPTGARAYFENAGDSKVYISSTASGGPELNFISSYAGSYTWRNYFDRLSTLALKWSYNGTDVLTLANTGAVTIAGALSFNGALGMGSNPINGSNSSKIEVYNSVTGNTQITATTVSGSISRIRFLTGTTSTERMQIDGSGNVGIGTTGPDRRLDILDASNPQLRLTYTDGSVYTDFQTNSSGNLSISPTGGNTNVTGHLSATSNVFTNAGFVARDGSNTVYGVMSAGSNTGGTIKFTNNSGNDFNRLQFGGTTSSYPAIKRNGTGIDIRLADDSAYAALTASNLISTATVRLKGYTVATLPAGTQGDTAFVTDALAPTFLATVVGGGAIKTPVFFDGANWVAY